MENKFEQMASNSQSEHQVKQFKSKQQLKKGGINEMTTKNNLHADTICRRYNGRDYR